MHSQLITIVDTAIADITRPDIMLLDITRPDTMRRDTTRLAIATIESSKFWVGHWPTQLRPLPGHASIVRQAILAYRYGYENCE